MTTERCQPLLLSKSVYRDKIMGCWRGKTAGGSLGAPLEKMWGDRTPFNVSFYEKIQEGGIPNDDLEIQLIWLMLLEDRGLDITCRDLAEYWLNTINYNPDEYGLHKTNLRQGLTPPISGAYNNLFKDSMGCPIRSEIWACIAPGMADVAMGYAWHDAVCDHAQGESVFGELFNAAIESAAFFVSDRDTLLDFGLSLIPETSKTARTISEARRLHRKGASWLEARNAVMEFAYSPNAQYSPINLGFQTLGWLYGEDFGDALCKAVNCGWDTDCTGATLGSILGIIAGASGLPTKWTDPIGDMITTNESWNGLKNLRIARNIPELTERTIEIGKKVLDRFPERICLVDDSPGSESGLVPQIGSLVNADHVEKVLERRQDEITYPLQSVVVGVRYPSGPVISCEAPCHVEVTIKSRCPDPVKARVTVIPPGGFNCSVESLLMEVGGYGSERVALTFTVSKVERVQTSNTGFVHVHPQLHPTPEAVPVVLMGARRWLVSQPYSGKRLEDPLPQTILPLAEGVSASWKVCHWIGNELDVEPCFRGQAGVLFVQHYFYNPETRSVRLGVSNNSRMKVWLNGQYRHQTTKTCPLRASYWGDENNYFDLILEKGWHHLCVKLERGDNPVECHFTGGYDSTMWHGMDDLAQTRFPWEAPELSGEVRHDREIQDPIE